MTRPYTLEDSTLDRPVIRSNLKYGVLSRIISAEYTVDVASPPVIMLNPTTGALDVLLPPEAEGLVYWIVNLATGNIITLKDDADAAFGGNKVGVLNSVMAVCDGTAWRGFSMPLATS